MPAGRPGKLPARPLARLRRASVPKLFARHSLRLEPRASRATSTEPSLLAPAAPPVLAPPVLAPLVLERRVLERLEAPRFDPLGSAADAVDVLVPVLALALVVALAAALLVALLEAPPHAASSSASRTISANAAALRCLLHPTSGICLLVAWPLERSRRLQGGLILGWPAKRRVKAHGRASRCLARGARKTRRA
jgi:hypothetical protein